MKNFITGRRDDTAIRAWLRLAHTTGGPGRGAARRLLARFGLPHHIFAASRASLREVVSAAQVEALLAAPSAGLLELIERTLAWLAAPDRYVLTLADRDYPPALLTIADPPLLLYARGQPALLQRPAVAVVGSRSASRQGLLHAERFSEALSHAGRTVASGLALGIDSAAHEGGLRGAGSTLAVIGTGIDLSYPARNRLLAERIARQGCVVSEYALGTPPLAENFPRRNRLISGLSQAVLVVEAALRSGSLITARVAADQGRDVFAIPGSIHSPLSKGCHALIKQGAKLVESIEDVLEELALPGADGGSDSHSERLALASAPLNGAGAVTADADLAAGAGADAVATATATATATAVPDALLRHIGFDPLTLDQLALRSGQSAAALQAELLLLELNGQVELLPGGAYRRMH